MFYVGEEVEGETGTGGCAAAHFAAEDASNRRRGIVRAGSDRCEFGRVLPVVGVDVPGTIVLRVLRRSGRAEIDAQPIVVDAVAEDGIIVAAEDRHSRDV